MILCVERCCRRELQRRQRRRGRRKRRDKGKSGMKDVGLPKALIPRQQKGILIQAISVRGICFYTICIPTLEKLTFTYGNNCGFQLLRNSQSTFLKDISNLEFVSCGIFNFLSFRCWRRRIEPMVSK